MDGLDRLGLRETIIKRFDENKPTMTVCLGLQLLCAESEEDRQACLQQGLLVEDPTLCTGNKTIIMGPISAQRRSFEGRGRTR